MGDILLEPQHHQESPPRIGDHLLSLLASVDLRVANLEAQFTARERPVEGEGLRLRADPHYLWVIRALRLDAVTCANNHVLDFGAAAIRESIGQLGEAGVATCGIGVNDIERARPALLHAHGVSVAMLGYCDDWLPHPAENAQMAPAGVCDEAILANIRAARNIADVVVLQLHWGYEYVVHPLLDHRDRARRFVDAGADLVLCHHAHVPMGIERRGRGLIAYGLGNFVAGYHPNSGHPWWNHGVVLLASVGTNGVGHVHLVPIGTKRDGLVEVLEGREAEVLLGGVYHAGGRLGDDGFLRFLQNDRIVREGLSWARRLHSALDQSPQFTEHCRWLLLPRQRRLISLLKNRGGMWHHRLSTLLEAAAAEPIDQAHTRLRPGDVLTDLLRSRPRLTREPIGRLP